MSLSPGARAALAGLILASVAVEAALQLADIGVLDAARLRSTAYEYGAFWPGLLRDWSPNYLVQPATMFLSYGFLHGGAVHLVLNMVTLVSLGTAVLQRVTAARFVVIYFGSMVGGAAVYGLLAAGPTPMVGASGALFGLAGALLAWLWEDQPTLRDALVLAGRAVVLLVALNVVLYFALAKQLAWQTHLGGFLAGWVLAILVDPPRRGRRAGL
jgi:membrane associated rhomboid family serine protease